MGKYFTWPIGIVSLAQTWNEATPLDRDTCPDWALEDSDNWGKVRYLFHTSWEFIPPDDMEYFYELESAPDCIIIDADEGDGCVHHVYIRCPEENCTPDHWSWLDAISSLDDLVQSEEYQNYQFGAAIDDWLEDPERMQRCDDAAKDGRDGSTHGERIADMRNCLADCFCGRLTEQTRTAIEAEIDACEKWHIDNGSIDQQVN